MMSKRLAWGGGTRPNVTEENEIRMLETDKCNKLLASSQANRGSSGWNDYVPLVFPFIK